jgi:hypothetical protein
MMLEHRTLVRAAVKPVHKSPEVCRSQCRKAKVSERPQPSTPSISIHHLSLSSRVLSTLLLCSVDEFSHFLDSSLSVKAHAGNRYLPLSIVAVVVLQLMFTFARPFQATFGNEAIPLHI